MPNDCFGIMKSDTRTQSIEGVGRLCEINCWEEPRGRRGKCHSVVCSAVGDKRLQNQATRYADIAFILNACIVKSCGNTIVCDVNPKLVRTELRVCG